MTAYPVEAKAERLHEMKRQSFRRCSLEALNGTMDPPETWVELIEHHVYAEIVERYLRGFVAPVNEKNDCPCCGFGFFGWGLVHGQGNCSCGWPATLYHRVYDTREDGDLLCDRKGCGKRRDEHVENTIHGDQGDRVELRCPELEGHFNDFQAPLVAGFTRLLWVHPYNVHMRRDL